MAEQDKPQTAFIVAATVSTLVLLAGLLVFVTTYFDFAVRDEINRKVLTHENTYLRQLRAEEQEKLSRYQWVDQKAGVARLPIDRAVELTLKDWPSRPAGLVVAPPPAAPAPAVAPAAETKHEPAKKSEPEKKAAP